MSRPRGAEAIRDELKANLEAQVQASIGALRSQSALPGEEPQPIPSAVANPRRAVASEPPPAIGGSGRPGAATLTLEPASKAWESGDDGTLARYRSVEEPFADDDSDEDDDETLEGLEAATGRSGYSSTSSRASASPTGSYGQLSPQQPVATDRGSPSPGSGGASREHSPASEASWHAAVSAVAARPAAAARDSGDGKPGWDHSPSRFDRPRPGGGGPGAQKAQQAAAAFSAQAERRRRHLAEKKKAEETHLEAVRKQAEERRDALLDEKSSFPAAPRVQRQSPALAISAQASQRVRSQQKKGKENERKLVGEVEEIEGETR